ncbi:type II toxin-antitoxin system RelE/ParE family toxin [Mesorhizobium sp. B283B1A]|nr:type II toxin-antitoxin system RelE/ParE family toxin [Mesorhizobium sp. B283B1A]
MEAYADDPNSLANMVKALQGSTARRLRVGDYRVVFEETDQEIVVTKIGPRGSVYD